MRGCAVTGGGLVGGGGVCCLLSVRNLLSVVYCVTAAADLVFSMMEIRRVSYPFIHSFE